MWKPINHLHIIDMEKWCFMVKFADEQDYFKSLMGDMHDPRSLFGCSPMVTRVSRLRLASG
ncbi:hypothetical protein LINPERHAP1_LOCUS4995 [Linum perenne]